MLDPAYTFYIQICFTFLVLYFLFLILYLLSVGNAQFKISWLLVFFYILLDKLRDFNISQFLLGYYVFSLILIYFIFQCLYLLGFYVSYLSLIISFWTLFLPFLLTMFLYLKFFLFNSSCIFLYYMVCGYYAKEVCHRSSGMERERECLLSSVTELTFQVHLLYFPFF